MQYPALMQKISSRFEMLIVLALQLVMMIVIGVAIYELLKLIYHAAAASLFDMDGTRNIVTVADLQRILQRAFGGVLLILLGLELLDTLKAYFNEHRIRLEIILIVAIIAVGRHIILIDFDHLDGLLLIGTGVLMLALTGGYFLIKKATRETAVPQDSSS